MIPIKLKVLPESIIYLKIVLVFRIYTVVFIFYLLRAITLGILDSIILVKQGITSFIKVLEEMAKYNFMELF